MDPLVATGLLALFAVGAGVFVAKRWLAPLMQRHRLVLEQPATAARPWYVKAVMVGYFALLNVPVWAFATGRGKLGVILLVAIVVLPEFVIVPLHIVASRRRAAEARARRLAGR